MFSGRFLFILVAIKRKTIMILDENYNAQRELWDLFKGLISFAHTFDVVPLNGELSDQPKINGVVHVKLGDGTLGFAKVTRHSSKSSLTKAKHRWRDWHRARQLEEDDYYIATMEHLNRELEAGCCSPQQYGRHTQSLREDVTQRIQKRTKEYEKSIGIIDSDFAKQRRAAKVSKAA